MELSYDVLIVGAGPSGVSCAMHLRNSGLRIAVIDKSIFPRDKICGDAIPGPSWRVLRRLIPNSENEIDQVTGAQKIKSSVINYQKKRLLSVFWKTKAYNIPRHSFDNYLFQKLKSEDSITVLEGDRVSEIERENSVFQIKTSKGFLINTKFIVGADGANSIVRRKLGRELKNENSNGVSVRAYFKDIDFPNDANYFYIRKNFPGYFWIFPLENNLFNVGIGYANERIGRELDIKKSLTDFINSDEDLKVKFSKGEMTTKVVGHKLPFGGAKQDYSGDGYLLSGDAANLVDPMMGHGIDKALISGELAGKQIVDCFRKKDWSAEHNKCYDKMIVNKLQKDLKRSFHARNLFMNKLWVLPLIVPFAKLFSKRCK